MQTEESKRNKSEKMKGRIYGNRFCKYKKIMISCKNCGKIFEGNTGWNRKIFCSSICHNLYQGKNLSQYRKYQLNSKFTFNIYKYPDRFDLTLIEKFGWYHPIKNPNGISRDHVYSIKQGFINNIPVEIIKHPANCNLIFHKINNQKNDNCGITIQGLQEKIKNFELNLGANPSIAFSPP